MRYLELLVTDLPDAEVHIRTEWIHRDHIETIEPYTLPGNGHPMLWLEVTLTSGRTRYIPLQPVHPDHADDVARSAIAALLDSGTEPVHAATLDPPRRRDERPE